MTTVPNKASRPVHPSIPSLSVLGSVSESNLPVDVKHIRSDLRTNAAAIGNAPLDSLSGAYTSDGEREGVALVPPPPTL